MDRGVILDDASTDEEGSQGPSLLASMPLTASSFLGELDAAQVAELGAYASRLLGLGPVWIFAEEKAVPFAQKLFDDTPGLEGITVAYVPWTRSGR